MGWTSALGDKSRPRAPDRFAGYRLRPAFITAPLRLAASLDYVPALALRSAPLLLACQLYGYWRGDEATLSGTTHSASGDEDHDQVHEDEDDWRNDSDSTAFSVAQQTKQRC